MNPIEIQAYAAFEHALQADPGFTPREGQRKMALQVAHTMSSGTLGDADNPMAAIAVIQAGTGVGKSLAASVPAITAAVQRNARVIIATATIALQEQLVHKDLPRFSKLFEKPFKFVLAKGRSNYVCKVKLDQLAGGKAVEALDLFGDDEPVLTGQDAVQAKNLSESSVVIHRELAKDLASGKWDGEKDTAGISGAGFKWERLAADRNTCTARRCPQFRDCTYYAARKRLGEADVIVANHALLLSSLGTKLLPELKDSLLIVDEGHELPNVALGQFAAEVDLTSLSWLDQLGMRIQKVGTALKYDSTAEAVTLCRDVKRALSAMQTLAMDLFEGVMGIEERTVRLKHGVLPEGMLDPMREVQSTSIALAKHMSSLSTILNDQINEQPENAQRLTSMYAALGALAPRLENVLKAAKLMIEHEDEPNAKWFSFSDTTGYVTIKLHASPLDASQQLKDSFWSHVRSAIVTSATLTSCGSFDFFLGEAGLRGNPSVTTLEVGSPFDFQKQGHLVVVKTVSNPKQMEAYNLEVTGEFLADAATVTGGALALFTSRKHMEKTHQSMPESLAARVLVQGAMSRTALLSEHKRRIDAGYPSIILGLQSFGQGVDLPGRYCETVFIAKLPFSPPTDSIAEARAEWLTTQGRSSFDELALPATGVKLNQWSGRLIRTETDVGRVVCYDKRLAMTTFGKRLLSGMPTFRLSLRQNGEEMPQKQLNKREMVC